MSFEAIVDDGHPRITIAHHEPMAQVSLKYIYSISYLYIFCLFLKNHLNRWLFNNFPHEYSC